MSQVVSWRTAYGCRTKRRVLLASSRVRKDRVSGRKELVECRWLSRCSLKNSAERRPRAHSLISLRKCSYSTFTIELPGDACASKKTVCLCRGSTFRKKRSQSELVSEGFQHPERDAVAPTEANLWRVFTAAAALPRNQRVVFLVPHLFVSKITTRGRCPLLFNLPTSTKST